MQDFASLMEKYDPVIKGIVKSYSVRCKQYGIDPEDLMQISYLTLFEISSEKSIDDVDFLAYLRKTVTRRLYHAIRNHSIGKSMYEKCKVDSGKFEYPTPCQYDDEQDNDVGDALFGIIEDDSTIVDYKTFLESLPIYLRVVLYKLLDGYSVIEIGDQLSITRSSVHRRLTEIKRRYREFHIGE